ncbi:alkaline phosphatase family protein [Caulobacter sp. Root655]|uniref:alkaline phosphatase family protein n=1 Tax=Caulobacter sp. Root655 TaxID=1736578 RepID=UPI000AD1D26F|nr:alkaline phosphatase family protein [Caulobacter sp. Root655]
MSTPQTAQVYITNNTDGTAAISLWHNNSDYGTESGSWTAAPGQQVGPLTVHFNTGWGSFTVLDYWSCEISVTGGTTPGLYESSGVLQYSDWKECQLQSADAGQNLGFTVDTQTFVINLDSDGTSTPMNPVDRVSAQAYVTNNTDGHATITLFHNNSTDGTQSATWFAAPGEQVGPLTVYFRLGLDVALVLDYWAVKMAVQDGSAPGVYASTGSWTVANWKECQLQSADAGQNLPLTVDTSSFLVNLPSGGCPASMTKVGPYTQVDNVFVLMLENHSFDNIFAFSGIPNITVATSANSNQYNGVTYNAGSPAPPAMPTDPGHEFSDVVEQLAGPGTVRTPWTAYNQPIVNTGFVANYATTTTEITSKNPGLPTADEYGDIMLGFTPSQVPVIYQLATTFAICNQWHSSIPGPTWPNRFFVHGASSAGWADSPGSFQIGTWEAPLGGGFTYPSGASIYDKLTAAGLQWRIYVDENGPVLGGVPQVAALKGIVYKVNTNDFSSFASDLQGPYPYAYTFIEPNYGDVLGGSYVGGSSQHPMDSVAGGEALIKATYEAIRNSPVWERSLLIITYDEHGGFYDSVQPGAATPPGDGSPQDLSINSGGFLFDWYGVRVPAVIVSPLIPQGAVDLSLYDHASVSATLNALYGVGTMTQRDAGANDVLSLLSLTAPRTDCPTVLNNPASLAARPAALATSAEAGAQPLPETGNTQGFLQVLAKTDVELARGDPAEVEAIKARLAGITTAAQAEAYAREVVTKANLARATRAPTAPPPRPRAAG